MRALLGKPIGSAETHVSFLPAAHHQLSGPECSLSGSNVKDQGHERVGKVVATSSSWKKLPIAASMQAVL